jgi:hypothetical protein
VKLAGYRLVPLRSLAAPAYIAGLHLAFKYLTACGSLREVLAQPLNLTLASSTIAAAYRLWHQEREDGTPGLGSLEGLLPCEALCGVSGPDFVKLFDADRTGPINDLQKILSLSVHAWRRDAFLETSGVEARARIFQCSAPESGLWLLALPISEQYVLADPHVTIAFALRLGLPIPQLRQGAYCVATCPAGHAASSGHIVDEFGRHLLTCPAGRAGGGMTYLADTMYLFGYSLPSWRYSGIIPLPQKPPLHWATTIRWT